MNQIRTTDNPSTWGIAGAFIAGLGAAACCLGPLVLLALGVGGAGASSLKVLDPYRPIFIVIAVVLLGFAFYRAYRTPAAAACEADGSCAVPRAARITVRGSSNSNFPGLGIRQSSRVHRTPR